MSFVVSARKYRPQRFDEVVLSLLVKKNWLLEIIRMNFSA